jgi:hypothetical protein
MPILAVHTPAVNHSSVTAKNDGRHARNEMHKVTQEERNDRAAKIVAADEKKRAKKKDATVNKQKRDALHKKHAQKHAAKQARAKKGGKKN